MAKAMMRLSMTQCCRFLLHCSPARPPIALRRCAISKRSCSASASSHQIRSEVSISFGTHLIPHPSKADKGGEDAFFVSNFNGGVFAIADGVSGWAVRNVNPALFSQELMANASCLVMDHEVNYNPQILLGKAHAATSSIGSATAIVAMLEKNGTLKLANVGDCGLRVLRKGEVIFSTTPQEHYFDCPYQLSSQIIGQTYRDAVVSNVDLLEGDMIVVGSDGLFDNVFDHEIVSTISRFNTAVEAAKALADLACNHSMDANFDSPYSLEARNKGFDVPFWKKILGKKLIGGKPDDITVIVGQVVSSADVLEPSEAFQG
ncbi:Protein-serine/threonine phosphatase protein [Dioscorea alata]|uniref:Protein-serine/threonine phosphatase protein n=1 Tax=Dioscorea alata TaxID=55571 RepID=A0ACB7VTG2_DIOAL|nr:Protein-serine/threonine phosphatase protein [Dioscorea alata]